MPLKKREEPKKGSRAGTAGKAALLVGGAGLLLFILGIKRRHRLDDGREIEVPAPRDDEEEDDDDREE